MQLPELNYGDIIEIVWVDIVGDAAWTPRSVVDTLKPVCCMYSGYYVGADEDCVRCCNTIATNDGNSDYYIFPLGVIRKLDILKRSTYECNSDSE